MRYFMFITAILNLFCYSNLSVNGDLITLPNGQDDLQEMLHTEKVLIDTLRQYIDAQEQKLDELKRKTLEIKNVYDDVGENREAYLNNPINAVTMLRRFTTEWKELTDYADDYLDTEELTKNLTQQMGDLTFPSEDDYDSALISLLRIQDMFQMEPQRLSLGELNGMKLGSEMSWSDCLEIGLKSSKNGYQTYAKFWMEAALEKIPNVAQRNTNATSSTEQQQRKEQETESKFSAHNHEEYHVKARMTVLKSLLNVEYKAGNLKKALKIANEMLEINPKQKNIIKALKQIETELKKNKYNNNQKAETKKEKAPQAAIEKTDEELLIEEICRQATNGQQQQQIHTASLAASSTTYTTASAAIPHCTLLTDNLKWLILQPLKVELLSLDPFVVIYHDALSGTQLDELKEFLVEAEDNGNSNADDPDAVDDTLQLTKIGLKKMRQINEKLHYVTGHGRDALTAEDWHLNRYNFENMMEVQQTTTQKKTETDAKRQAGVFFNLQQPVLGGSVIFPQLELSVNLPKGSVLYWSNMNEFGAEDYRSNFHICPAIVGTQLTANAYIQV